MPEFAENFKAENFLGLPTALELPQFAPHLMGNVLTSDHLHDTIYADYINYLVVTNRLRRSPVYAALKIDQAKIKTAQRIDNWRIDSRIGNDFQLNNDYYQSNPWDRGHLARRSSAAWGDDIRAAQQASNDTFYYSNASLQHANYNQDEWRELEDWVLDLDITADGRIVSFSGPVYGEFDRTITPEGRDTAIIPAGFFKVVCFKDKTSNDLGVRAFVMWQDEAALEDRSGRNMFNYQRYQVSVTEIEHRTGLVFADQVYEKNPIKYYDRPESRELNVSHFPEIVEVDSADEMISDGSAKRTYIADDEVMLFIAAAMVNPKGNEKIGEWISLINLDNEPINVTGWELKDTQNRTLKLDDALSAEQRKIQPGQAVALKPIRPLQLANDKGGNIYLFDEKKRRIDRVKYTKDDVAREGQPVIFADRAVHE